MLYLFVVVQSCPALCDPMNGSMPGFPILHPLLGFAQTHVHWVCDAIQPSHPPLPPSFPAFNLLSMKFYFKKLAFCIRWSKYWSFSLSPSSEYLGLISFRIDRFDLLCSQKYSQESSPAAQLESSNSSAFSLLYSWTLISIHHDYWKNHSLGYINFCQQSGVSAF